MLRIRRNIPLIIEGMLDFNFFMNDLVYFMRNDNRRDQEIMLTALQPGFNLSFAEKYSLKSAASYYKFSNL